MLSESSPFDCRFLYKEPIFLLLFVLRRMLKTVIMKFLMLEGPLVVRNDFGKFR